jgi:hypothetical protein
MPGAGGAGGGGGGGVARIKVEDWIDDLAINYSTPVAAPDTVEDKVSIIIDTDDPAAFDPLLAKKPEQP